MSSLIKLPYFKNGVENAVNKLSAQLINWVESADVSGGVIGLSGGLDSSTIAHLWKYAFDKYRPGQFDLIGVIMRSKANATIDYLYARDVIFDLKIYYEEIDIETVVRGFKRAKKDVVTTKYNLGNLYSEIRAVLLSRIAAEHDLLVVGTGNKDEDEVLGYFTKRGDGAVDNNILGGIPKRLVREIAKYFKVSDKIINREPTAGQWKGQTDKDDLGYTYDTAELVYNGVQQGLFKDDIVADIGCKGWVVDDVIKRHEANKHKKELPPIGKLEFIYK